MTDLDVFSVLEEPTGIWLAMCGASDCGPGLHTVSECATKAAADRAAAKHRRAIAENATPSAPAPTCTSCGQRIPPKRRATQRTR